MEVSDWIHDVRLLDVDSFGSFEKKVGIKEISSKHNQQGTIGSFLIAMGMANNNCEIWGFHMTLGENREELALLPTRLQCIMCDVRCMTYSLSFYGWDNEAEMDVDDSSICNGNNAGTEKSIVPF